MNLLNIFALSGLANFVLSLVFGLLVYLKNFKEEINKVFFILSITITGWSLSYYSWLNCTEKVCASFWLYILSVFSVFIPILFFHWLLIILSLYQNSLLKKILIFSYILGFLIVSSLVWKPDLLIHDIKNKLFFPFWPDAGILYSFYIIFIYIGLVALSLYLLYKRLIIETDPKLRSNLIFLIIAVIIGFGGGFSNFFLWYDIKIVPYGNILVGLYVILFGYATIESRFFNIKLLGTEFFVYTLLLIQIINLFKPSVFFYEKIFNLGVFIFSLILSLILIRSAFRESEYAEKLEQLNRIKSEFLSFASHQVKAPMAVVKGYAELIETQIENVPPQAKDFAHKIRESVNRLLELVEEFMDYRRIEEGKIELNFEEVDLVSLIKEFVNNFNLIAKEKNLELTFETSMEQCLVKVDKMRFSQVIQNLIDNAIKYTNQGWVKVNLQKEDNSILITVADSGIGMSKELQQKLFGEFVRDPSIKKEIRGTGLGLYIAKYIVEAHQGKIWAESEGEGKGSKFYVKLALN
jgi:signal transduction histidine kinase